MSEHLSGKRVLSMKPRWAALAMVVGLAPAVCAEPLDVKRVSADAKWLVHVDVDAMKAGKVPKTVGRLWLQLPSVAEKLNQVKGALGLEPLKDLHGITVFGRQYAEAGSVVVLHADVDRERLTTFLRWRPGYRAESYGNHELIAWTEKEGKKDEHTVTGCFHGPTVIAFGRDAAEVKNALDVLDGTSAGLAEGHALFAAETPAGTMIQARAVDLADVELPFKSPLVRKSRVLLLTLGEHDDEAFAVARVVTESAEVAGQLQAVVEGFLAMAELQFDSDQLVTKLLQAVQVSIDEKTVIVRFRAQVDDVSKLIERVWTRQFAPK